MKDLWKVKELQDLGMITDSEYDTISKRLAIENNEYNYKWINLLDEFYEWCKLKYSKVTASGYKNCMYSFIRYLTNESDNNNAFQREYKSYSFVDVNSFINGQFKRGFSNQAIAKQKHSISVFGTFLNEKGIKTPDISSIKVSIKDEANKTTLALRHEEIIDIANKTSLKNKVCILLTYEACLRRIELIAIRKQDFDFDNNQLFIMDNGKVDRVCILSNSTIKLVKEYINELYESIDKWNESRAKRGVGKRDDFGYIFQNSKVVIPSYFVLQKALKESAKNYYSDKVEDLDELSDKVSNFSFETLRNSRRLYLLSKGKSVTDVMQYVGDKNYMSTFRFVKLVPMLYPNVMKLE